MRRKSKFTPIVSEAEKAGLSYGQYVAREHTKRGVRKPIPQNYASINDRKRLKIGAPMYFGKTTVQAAFRVDCPRLASGGTGRKNA